jgi:hypothetical protein
MPIGYETGWVPESAWTLWGMEKSAALAGNWSPVPLSSSSYSDRYTVREVAKSRSAPHGIPRNLWASPILSQMVPIHTVPHYLFGIRNGERHRIERRTAEVKVFRSGWMWIICDIGGPHGGDYEWYTSLKIEAAGTSETLEAQWNYITQHRKQYLSIQLIKKMWVIGLRHSTWTPWFLELRIADPQRAAICCNGGRRILRTI